MKTTVAAPPPAPAPVNPGQAAMDYTQQMASPELQNLLFQSEAQYRPQYTQLNLQDMNQYLMGAGGQPGLLSQLAVTNEFNIGQQNVANTAQRTSDIANVEQLGQRASAAFRNANPELQQAINNAQSLQAGGYTAGARMATPATQNFEQYIRNNPDLLRNWNDNVSKNTQMSMAQYGQQHYSQAGQQEGREVPMTAGDAGSAGTRVAGPGSPYQAFQDAVTGQQPNFGNINFSPAQAAMLGAAPQAASQGYNAAMLGSAPMAQGQGYNASLLGNAPQMQSQGYNASMLGAAPMVGSQGYNAAMAAPVANVASQNINAGQVGGGLLGMSLYGQALGAGGLGAAGQQLDARAQELAKSTGAMTGDEIRAMEQQLRSSYGARGTLESGQSVSAEALGRLTNERQNRANDLGLAAQLNAGNQAELGANRGFQQGVQGAELGRAFQNVGNDMSAQAQNQQAALQAAMANQGISAQQAALNQASQNQAGQFGAGAANQAQLANQAMMAQYGLANQASQNQAGQFGAASANQAAANNQQMMANYGLANQQALNQAGQFGAQAGNVASLANQGILGQYGLANQQSANQAGQFGAGAANQASLANQAMLGQYGLSNQSAANQFGLYNNQQNLATQEANRAFNYGQYGDQLRNLGILGQFGQSQLGADRNYALQLAGLQSSMASDPFQAILGRSSGVLPMGMQQQGAAGQYTQGLQGPQLFDPNAGINLALGNAANQGNYQAATYGARAAAQGASNASYNSMLGGLGSSIIGNINPIKGLFG